MNINNLAAMSPANVNPALGIQQIKERQEFEHYTKVKLLGEGSFGKAYLVTRNSDKLQCVQK